MIARIWQGWAPKATAQDYERHYREQVEPKLRAVPGFHGGKLLRRDGGEEGSDAGEVQFTSITFFTSIADIRAFAGPAYQSAVVDEAARAVLSHWDEQVAHHDVAVDVPYQPSA